MEITSDLRHPSIAEIEGFKYLRTIEIAPVLGNLLELRVGEAVALEDTHTFKGIEDVQSLEVTEKSNVFLFKFWNFVSYSVTDEMYVQHSPDDIFEGGRIRSYTKSYFLDFVSNATWATSDIRGPLLHYQVNTLDHTIDVVTLTPPKLVVKEGQD